MPRVIVILLTQQKRKLPDPSLTQIPLLTGQAHPSNHHACLSTHSLFKMQLCHNNEQKRPSKVMGGQEKLCMPDTLFVWG